MTGKQTVPHKKRVAVLGSTGSVGRNTLDVMARHPDRFEVVALAAGSQVQALREQALRFRPRMVALANPEAARELAGLLKSDLPDTACLSADSAIEDIACNEQVDAVMAAIVGAAGLRSALAAARSGKQLLLANKESLVVGGALFMQAVRAGGGALLPIDSEHSAIFQSLPEDSATWEARVDKLILTASGGPFRTRDPATLRHVTPAEACAHPNWQMGRKISVDSATMMNKALEVIEARHLFSLPPQRLDVVLHPQSVIHSMVQYRDASIVAQLGTPDMRVPIAYGLSWPDRIESGAATLDFQQLAALTFEDIRRPDHLQRYPGLQLAWDALAAPEGTTAVLNAANEVAVEAFLQSRIRFDQIHALNAATLGAVLPRTPHTVDDLLAIDAEARRWATEQIGRL